MIYKLCFPLNSPRETDTEFTLYLHVLYEVLHDFQYHLPEKGMKFIFNLDKG